VIFGCRTSEFNSSLCRRASSHAGRRRAGLVRRFTGEVETGKRERTDPAARDAPVRSLLNTTILPSSSAPTFARSILASHDFVSPTTKLHAMARELMRQSIAAA
jgi:hypothetical protein